MSLLGVERPHVELRVAADEGLQLPGRARVLADPLAVELDELAPEAELAVGLEHDEPRELVVRPRGARHADRAHRRERRREAQEDVRRCLVVSARRPPAVS